MFFLKIDQLPVLTSYLFVIGQFVLKVISYWLTANNRKLINFFINSILQPEEMYQYSRNATIGTTVRKIKWIYFTQTSLKYVI